MEKRMLYEIETRVHFNSQEEAFNTLPFLYECLKKKTEFETRMYGCSREYTVYSVREA